MTGWYKGPYSTMIDRINEGLYSVPAELFDENRGKYNSAVRAKEQLFKRDLEVAYGVENHPKKDLAYRIAEEFGHASGMQETLAYYDEIVQLIR